MNAGFSQRVKTAFSQRVNTAFSQRVSRALTHYRIVGRKYLNLTS